MTGMSTHPAIALPQSANKEVARGEVNRRENPFWFRWEILLPLIALLALIGSLASVMDKLFAAKPVRH